MSWQQIFKRGQELVLATASKKGEPNANVVISLGFADGKLLIADVMMNRTIKNLAENNRICVYAKSGKQYRRLAGTVKLFTAGKLFDLAVKRTSGYTVKTVIVVTAKEVFDLDKCKKIL